MVKANSTIENKNLEAMELLIIETLLNGEAVVIPDFGHLELKSLGDRRTVFFKPFINGENSSEQTIVGVTDFVSTPLKEGKTVDLPLLGVFRPVKRVGDDIHISFIPAANLRKILNNGKEEVDAVARDLSENMEEIIEIEHSSVLKTANTHKNSRVGDIIVPRDDTYERRKSRNLSGALWLIAIVITVVVVIFATLLLKDKDTDERVELVSQSESVNLTELAEQHYGHPAYWIYIYDANSDKLKSPLNIVKDVSIDIPDLKTEYDVDITDSLEIKRAIVLGDIVIANIKKNNMK